MQDINIVQGVRGEIFRDIIKNFLKQGKLKDNYIMKLLTDDNIKLYGQAFTSQAANPNSNYEIFEILGDATLYNFLVYYCPRRYPHLNNANGVSIISLMKARYGKKDFLAELAEKNNFYQLITHVDIPEGITGKERLEKSRKELLEDCFESFIGVTVYILDKEFMIGVGNAIAYNLLKNIYDTVQLETDPKKLIPAITQLKEVFDSRLYTTIGKIVYDYKDKTTDIYKITDVYFVSNTNPDKKIKLGSGQGARKDTSKESSAYNSLLNLEKKGWIDDSRFDKSKTYDKKFDSQLNDLLEKSFILFKKSGEIISI